MKHEYITDTMLNKEFGSLIVADSDEIVAGCVFRPHSTFLELYLMAVNTNKQRSGLGSLLLDHLKSLDCFNSGEVQLMAPIQDRPIVVYADLRALKFFEK